MSLSPNPPLADRSRIADVARSTPVMLLLGFVLVASGAAPAYLLLQDNPASVAGDTQDASPSELSTQGPRDQPRLPDSALLRQLGLPANGQALDAPTLNKALEGIRAEPDALPRDAAGILDLMAEDAGWTAADIPDMRSSQSLVSAVAAYANQIGEAAPTQEERAALEALPDALTEPLTRLVDAMTVATHLQQEATADVTPGERAFLLDTAPALIAGNADDDSRARAQEIASRIDMTKSVAAARVMLTTVDEVRPQLEQAAGVLENATAAADDAAQAAEDPGQVVTDMVEDEDRTWLLEDSARLLRAHDPAATGPSAPAKVPLDAALTRLAHLLGANVPSETSQATDGLPVDLSEAIGGIVLAYANQVTVGPTGTSRTTATGAAEVLDAIADSQSTLQRWSWIYSQAPPITRPLTDIRAQQQALGVAQAGLDGQTSAVAALRLSGATSARPVATPHWIDEANPPTPARAMDAWYDTFNQDVDPQVRTTAIADLGNLPDDVQQATVLLLWSQVQAHQRASEVLPAAQQLAEIKGLEPAIVGALSGAQLDPGQARVLSQQVRLTDEVARGLALEPGLILADATDRVQDLLGPRTSHDKGPDPGVSQPASHDPLPGPHPPDADDAPSPDPDDVVDEIPSTDDVEDEVGDTDPGTGGVGPDTPRPDPPPGATDPNRDVWFADPTGAVVVTGFKSTTHPDGQHVAVHLDLGGDDAYFDNAGGAEPDRAKRYAVSIDLGGDDEYNTTNPFAQGGVHGEVLDTQDGLLGAAPVGILVDADGNDTYLGGPFSQGSALDGGLGLLVDGDGADTYEVDGTWEPGTTYDVAGGQGYAVQTIADAAQPFLSATGLMVEGGGNDAYQAPSGQGSSLTLFTRDAQSAVRDSTGILIEMDGADQYSCTTSEVCLGKGQTGERTDYSRGEDGPAEGNGQEVVAGVRVAKGIAVDLGGQDEYPNSAPSPILVVSTGQTGGSVAGDRDSDVNPTADTGGEAELVAWASIALDLPAGDSDGDGYPDGVEGPLGHDTDRARDNPHESMLDEIQPVALASGPDGDGDCWSDAAEQRFGTDADDNASRPTDHPACPAPSNGLLVDLSLDLRTGLGPTRADSDAVFPTAGNTLPVFALGDTTSSTIEKPYLVTLDLGGSDTYTGAVGAARNASPPSNPNPLPLSSVAVDVDGEDRYVDPGEPAFGAGIPGAFGVLVDLAGDDAYEADEGLGAGLGPHATGILVDLAGDDDRTGGTPALGFATPDCTPPEAHPPRATSETMGSAQRTCFAEGLASGAGGASVGILMDADGDDRTTGPSQARALIKDTGGAAVAGYLDLSGTDAYLVTDTTVAEHVHRAQGRAVVGEGDGTGVAFFVDSEGTDLYAVQAENGTTADISDEKNDRVLTWGVPGDDGGNQPPGFFSDTRGLNDLFGKPVAFLQENADAAGGTNDRDGGDGDTLRRPVPTGPDDLDDPGLLLEIPRLGILVGGPGQDTFQGPARLTLDLGGDDVYLGAVGAGFGHAVNNTHMPADTALALDLGGDDTYLARVTSASGDTDPSRQGLAGTTLAGSQGAGVLGVGVHADLGGWNLFNATVDTGLMPRGDVGSTMGVAQGAGVLGVGVLYTEHARNTFETLLRSGLDDNDDRLPPAAGLSQGAASQGIGLLLTGNRQAADEYTATVVPAEQRAGDGFARLAVSQGSAASQPPPVINRDQPGIPQGAAVLLDHGGDDAYTAEPRQRSQGQGTTAFLVDLGGRDRFNGEMETSRQSPAAEESGSAGAEEPGEQEEDTGMRWCSAVPVPQLPDIQGLNEDVLLEDLSTYLLSRAGYYQWAASPNNPEGAQEHAGNATDHADQAADNVGEAGSAASEVDVGGAQENVSAAEQNVWAAEENVSASGEDLETHHDALTMVFGPGNESNAGEFWGPGDDELDTSDDPEDNRYVDSDVSLDPEALIEALSVQGHVSCPVVDNTDRAVTILLDPSDLGRIAEVPEPVDPVLEAATLVNMNVTVQQLTDDDCKGSLDNETENGQPVITRDACVEVNITSAGDQDPPRAENHTFWLERMGEPPIFLGRNPGEDDTFEWDTTETEVLDGDWTLHAITTLSTPNPEGAGPDDRSVFALRDSVDVHVDTPPQVSVEDVDNWARWVASEDVPGPATQPPTLGSGVLDAGDGHTCLAFTNNTVHCWGDHTHGQAPTWKHFDDKVVQVSAGGAHTCALVDDDGDSEEDVQGNVACWGDDSDGQVSGIPGTEVIDGNATQVAAGGAHTCALLSDRNVACWGEITTTPESGIMAITSGEAIQMSAGGGHACALVDDDGDSEEDVQGNVMCWGADSEDQTTGVPGTEVIDGNATQVAAGGAHTCALVPATVENVGEETTGQEEQNVICWGSPGTNHQGNDVVNPTTSPTYTALSASGDRTCAVLVNQTARCWTADDSREGDEYREGLDLHEVAAGSIGTHGHACGLARTMAVTCWDGDDRELSFGITSEVTVVGESRPVTTTAYLFDEACVEDLLDRETVSQQNLTDLATSLEADEVVEGLDLKIRDFDACTEGDKVEDENRPIRDPWGTTYYYTLDDFFDFSDSENLSPVSDTVYRLAVVVSDTPLECGDSPCWKAQTGAGAGGTFGVDDTAPSGRIHLDGLNRETARGGTIVVSWTSTDSLGEVDYVTLTGKRGQADPASISNPGKPPSGEGRWTNFRHGDTVRFELTVTDKAGNQGTASFQGTVDLVSPVLSDPRVSPKYVQSGAPVTFSVNATEEVGFSGAKVVIDGEAFSMSQAEKVELDDTLFTQRFTFDGWASKTAEIAQDKGAAEASRPEGYAFSFKVADAAGNPTTTAEKVVFVDDIDPLLLNATIRYPGGSAAGPGDLIQVHAEAADNFGVERVSLDASNLSSAGTVPLTGIPGTRNYTGTFVIDKEVERPGEDLTVRVKDLAGNTIDEVETVRVETTSVEAKGLDLRQVGATNATIEWRTELPSRGAVVVANTVTSEQQRFQVPTTDTEHALNLTGLQPSTSYIAEVVPANEAGRTAGSSTIAFTTGSLIEVNVTSPTPGQAAAGTVPVAWTATSPRDETLTYTVVFDSGQGAVPVASVAGTPGDEERVRISTHDLPDGPYTVSVEASQIFDHATGNVTDVLVDNTPPTVRLLSPAPGGGAPMGDVTLEAFMLDEGSGLHASSVRFVVDGNEIAPDEIVEGTATATVNLSTVRTHEISVVAADQVGNTAADGGPVRVDDSPPLIEDARVGDDDQAVVQPGATVPVRVTVTDDQTTDARFKAPGLGVDLQPMRQAGDTFVADLEVPANATDGQYTIDVEVTDASQHLVPARLGLTVDGTPPTLDTTNVEATGPGTASVTATTDEPANLVAAFTTGDRAPVEAATDRASKAPTLDVPGLIPGQTYAVEIQAVDRAGNTATRDTTLALPEDTVAPGTPGTPRASVLPNGSVSLSWSAVGDDVALDGYRVYRATGDQGPETVAETTRPRFTDHAAEPGTSYTYHVTAVDTAGNEGHQSPPVSATPTAVPRLDDATVSPDKGGPDTVFHFEVTYKGPVAPDPRVEVLVNGVPHRMAGPAADACWEGCTFTLDTKLPVEGPGTYNEHAFRAVVGGFVTQSPGDGQPSLGPVVSSQSIDDDTVDTSTLAIGGAIVAATLAGFAVAGWRWYTGDGS